MYMYILVTYALRRYFIFIFLIPNTGSTHMQRIYYICTDGVEPSKELCVSSITLINSTLPLIRPINSTPTIFLLKVVPI